MGLGVGEKMMIDTLRAFVGIPPVSFEWLEYVIVSCVFIILFSFVTNFFKEFARYVGGRR